MKPQFFILAGPNGAGKSTNGHFHIPSGLSIFNGDLVFAELQRQYPHIEPDRLGGGVAVALEKARDKALADRTDFAFETNFSNNMAVEITQIFKNEGYETSLIYFGLNDIYRSATRVDERVLLGGHQVPLEVIKYNFEEGIKRVTNQLADFDHIRFIDTSIPFSARVIALSNKLNGQHAVLDPNIAWFNKNFKTPLEHDFLQYQNGRSSQRPER